MKRLIIILTVLAMTLAFSRCTGMSKSQQGALSGAAIGAGGGAILSTIVGGSVLGGAAIGVGVGAVGGYLVGESQGKNCQIKKKTGKSKKPSVRSGEPV
jgi:osmotically inducible lipoprotein OsmB